MTLPKWTRFALVGPLMREYILPVRGRPALDIPGGEALYAAAALATWLASTAGDTGEPKEGLGLMARTGMDFPQAWLDDLARLGWRVEGVRRVPDIADSRRVRVYDAQGNPVLAGWARRFAERGYAFPPDLADHEMPGPRTPVSRPTPWTLLERDVPDWIVETRLAHFTPGDPLTHHLLPSVLRSRGVLTLTLDPDAAYMTAPHQTFAREVMQPFTVVQPSEEEMRTLFGGLREDLWGMSEEVATWGVPVVVVKRGNQGVWVYDGKARARWVLPAYGATRFRDPTGAGSAFAGGFLYGWHRTEDPVEAALHGLAVASVAVETVGALSLLETLPGLLPARLEVLREGVRRV